MNNFEFISPTKFIFGKKTELLAGKEAIGNYVKLEKKDVLEIYKIALK
ncbi:MAG: hypothetical protein JW703_05090 [Candidatus Diapherotrites archaeon]|nr:hypothetical protein [Candidatus Diapherotrites archaeon]